MAPPCPNFPTRRLPSAAQLDADGKLRKTHDGRRIDLARDCELLGLVQYECVVSRPEVRDSPVQCWPVQRLFRRYVLCSNCVLGCGWGVVGGVIGLGSVGC